MFFVRFGSLNKIKQKGYIAVVGDETDFHSPPARYGIYAFPRFSIYTFLLSGVEYVHDRIYKLKSTESLVYSEDEYQNHLTSGCKRHIKKLTKNLNTKLKYVHTKFITRDCDGDCDNCKLENCFDVTENHFVYAFKNPKKFEYKKDIWHHLYDEVDSKKIKKEHGSWILTSYDVWLKAYNRTLSKERSQYYRTGIKVSKDHHEVFIPEKI